MSKVAPAPPDVLAINQPGVKKPSVRDLAADRINKLANAYWSVTSKDKMPFNAKLVDDVYAKEISKFKIQRLMILEFTSYLENYLWPNFNAETASAQYIHSIMAMINEKFREGVPAWNCILEKSENYAAFFDRVVKLVLQPPAAPMTIPEKINYVLFLVNCFQSLENEIIRKPALQLVSLPLWHNLNPGRRQHELAGYPDLQKSWKGLRKREKKAVEEGKDPAQLHVAERTFIPTLIEMFFTVLGGIPAEGKVDPAHILFCERFVEFVVDLLTQLATRRFVRALLEDTHFLIRCRHSALSKRLPEGRLFSQLCDIMKFYIGFEINDQTGLALTTDDMITIHSSKIQSLQRIAFKYFMPTLRDLALSSIGKVETRKGLISHLTKLDNLGLRTLCVYLGLLGPLPEDHPPTESREMLVEILVAHHEARISQIDAINLLPLIPNEQILFDENLVPSDAYSGETVLALPKLNLQFLTFHDYLLRNFNLFRLESTYEIREDLSDAVRRMLPRRNNRGETELKGWARMALPIGGFNVTRIGRPQLGEDKPSEVLAEVSVNLASVKAHARAEWDSIRQHDVLFLVTVRLPLYHVAKDAPQNEHLGIKYVRGCEVVETKDGQGHTFVGYGDSESRLEGDIRKFNVLLDTNQYHLDVQHMAEEGGEDIYATFNLLVRRKPKENNFKAILETIRDLMNTRTAVPGWLHDIFLGYGDPAAAAYYNLPEDKRIKTVDFKDTFLTAEHLLESFPGREIVFTNEKESERVPPFRVTFPKDEKDPLLVEAYRPPEPGPYPEDKPKENKIRFTPVQIEAIKSGVQPGLTMIVGPPGTGKTDVAVQIMSNLYHNFPGQRTLLVTHSNNALNDLFEKIMVRDIKERHLIRLGMGERDLETEKDFSKFGRVNYMLGRRIEMLGQVTALARSLGQETVVEFTCETAPHFYRRHVLARWEVFAAECEKQKETASPDWVMKNFPFAAFFSDVFEEQFTGKDFEADWRTAQGCFKHIRNIFDELEETRAFEILKGGADRGNYLLTRQAKVIALTCTHAALKRGSMVELGFEYDNIVMEEAAQILEIETFIPMMLQVLDAKTPRLKRVIMLGDHHQLPPVVQNMAFQKYSHMDQSLFARFIRLGVPAIQLNYQGRMRSSLAELYRWRYSDLRDLPLCHHEQRFSLANPGFGLEYQFVNVNDYQGRGESEPAPHYYQNLGEAEYVVACFMYMRLLGYPASKISIITTYNGQKHLIRDVLEKRCAYHPFFGMPAKVTTVDKFQGQQNDYILLSLVRTRNVGHIRDVRRLVVAVSRARLGMYIFGRKQLFENCFELTPVFSQLAQRPSKLQLVPGETYPSTRTLGEVPAPPFFAEDVVHMGAILEQMIAHRTAYEMALARQKEEEEKPAAVLDITTVTAPSKPVTVMSEEAQQEAAAASKLTEEEYSKLAVEDEEEQQPTPAAPAPPAETTSSSTAESGEDKMAE